MSFDPKTNTITLRDDADISADTGSFFLKVLRDLAAKPSASEGLVRDWKVVEAWLRCEGRELSETDYEVFGVTFRSYLARGVAPSVELEPAFKEFSQLAKAEAWQIVPVPPELAPVFKRMLASHHQIQQKRANDALQFSAAMNSLSARSSSPPPSSPRVKRISSDVRLNWIPIVVSMVMLLMASGRDWPYGFYQLLRLVVFGTAIYVVVQTLNRRQYWPWIMGGIAILFNPVLQISFTQEEWRPIDFGVAVIFFVALVHMRPRMESF